MLISLSTRLPTRSELVACANLFKMSSVKYDVNPDTTPTSKNKKRLCFIKCTRFLDLADKLVVPDQFKLDTVAEVLDRGDKLNDVPILLSDERDYLNGDFSVRIRGHEGRHRALVLLSRDIHYMPVMFSGPRWSEQVDGSRFDRVAVWPKLLISEDGRNTITFPLARSQSDATAFDCVIL